MKCTPIFAYSAGVAARTAAAAASVAPSLSMLASEVMQ
jgi:hypothetical protein